MRSEFVRAQHVPNASPHTCTCRWCPDGTRLGTDLSCGFARAFSIQTVSPLPTSPANSVIDANHRTWAVPNLFICDGSVCPTQGSANPALTIMTLASRLAEQMASGAAMQRVEVSNAS